MTTPAPTKLPKFYANELDDNAYLQVQIIKSEFDLQSQINKLEYLLSVQHQGYLTNCIDGLDCISWVCRFVGPICFIAFSSVGIHQTVISKMECCCGSDVAFLGNFLA